MSRTVGALDKRTLDLIALMIDALAEYRPRTVRGLFYALLDPENGRPNSQQFYNQVQNAARMAHKYGHIAWTAIVDPGREPEYPHVWANLADFCGIVPKSLHYDPWMGKTRPIVWIEKAALLQPAREVCTEYRVPLYFGRGFNSVTVLYDLARRVGGSTVLVFGDHDPSGLDIPRALEATLLENWGVRCAVRRVALTLPQIDVLDLPPQRVKDAEEAAERGKAKGDTRAEDYKRYMRSRDRPEGECWELDALGPHEIKRLMSEAIKVFGPDFEGAAKREKRDGKKLAKALEGLR